MNRNNKAINSMLVLIIIVILVVVAVAAVYVIGSGSQPVEQPITVYIDGTEQTGNFTAEPQKLEWGTVTPGNTYTKNLTVTNNQPQPTTLILLTTAPIGNTLSWPYNNTAVAPTDTVSGSLTLALALDATSGSYTWRMLAVNSTLLPTPTPAATPKPSPTPEPTPVPNALQYEINWHEGIDNITVTVKTATPFVIFGDEEQPKTYLFTTGDKIVFEAKVKEGYEWVRWEFADGTSPVGDARLTVTRTGNFTVTAVAKLKP